MCMDRWDVRGSIGGCERYDNRLSRKHESRSEEGYRTGRIESACFRGILHPGSANTTSALHSRVSSGVCGKLGSSCSVPYFLSTDFMMNIVGVHKRVRSSSATCQIP